MTQKSSGQVMIEYETELQKSVNKTLDYFKQSDYVDCRINAYPTDTKYSLDVEIRNKASADFIMFDLDLKDFGNRNTHLKSQRHR